MNKKIKIIELLDNYADEKEIIMPKYVRYWDRIGHKDKVMLVCKENIIKKLDDCKIDLNDEVEILEDNTEEIEELESWRLAVDEDDYNTLNYTLDRFGKKIDELVKAVNSIRKDKNND